MFFKFKQYVHFIKGFYVTSLGKKQIPSYPAAFKFLVPELML
jgi:hypothetical protein